MIEGGVDKYVHIPLFSNPEKHSQQRAQEAWRLENHNSHNNPPLMSEENAYP